MKLTPSVRPDSHDNSPSAPSAFDANWYHSAYPDVALTGLSAEVHYEQFGAAMGRARNAEEALSGQGGLPAAWLEAATAQAEALAPASPDGPAPVRPTPQGQALSLRPRGADATTDTETEAAAAQILPLAPLRPAAAMPPALGLYAALTRLPAPEGAAAQDTLHDHSCFPDPFLTGDTTLANAAMLGEETLRLVFAGPADALTDTPAAEAAATLRLFQAIPEAPEALRLLAEVGLDQPGPVLLDAALYNPLMPLLLEYCDAEGYQAGLALLPFPSLLPGGLHGSERAAWQMSSDVMAEVRRLSDVLLRDLLNGAGSAVERIELDLRGAIGTERIFSPHVQSWLAALFGLAVQPLQAAAAATAPGETYLHQVLQDGSLRPTALRQGLQPRAAQGLVLSLPAEAMPSLAILTAPRGQLPAGQTQARGPFLVADAATLRPLWSTCLPTESTALATEGAPAQLPVLHRSDSPATPHQIADGSWLSPVHLAILLRAPAPVNPLQELLPADLPPATSAAHSAPGTETKTTPSLLSLVLEAEDPASLQLFLEGLAQQDLTKQAQNGLAGCELLLRVPPALSETALQQMEDQVRSRGFTCLPSLRRPPAQGFALDAAAAATSGELILFANTGILLQDPRCLSRMLQEIAAENTIGALGCALLQEMQIKKKTVVQPASMGLFPDRISFHAAPRMGIFEPDGLTALPASTYPVLANGFDFCLIRRQMITQTRDLRAGFLARGAEDLQLALLGFGEGYRSFCTTRVRAVTTRPRVRRDQIDPFGLACLLPSDWNELLNSVTILRALKG